MPRGSTLLISGLVFVLLISYHVNALNYGTTCSNAVDLTTSLGAGSGFSTLLDSPFQKSWYNFQLSRLTGSDICLSNSLSTFISSQQWVWYSLKAGSESHIRIATYNDEADTGTVDTVLFMTSICTSSSSAPEFCNDDFPGRDVKAGISANEISGTYKIAIGQFATSSSNGVTYSAGKTSLRQFCSYSCSVCSALPAKLFYPNSAVEYSYLTGGSVSTTCGTIYNLSYYTFTAPSAGSVLVSTCTADGAIKAHSLTTRIAVYTSCSSSPIQCGVYPLGCSSSAKATFTVTQGTTYTVLIGSSTNSNYPNGISDGKPVFTFTCATGTYDDDNNQNTACIPCATTLPNCKTVTTCTATSDTTCSACNDGFYLSSGSCLACGTLSNCNSVTCTTFSNSICTSCNNGYYINSGSCSTCTSRVNCTSVTCSTSSNSVCTACNSGSYLNSGSCPTCSSLANCNTVTCTGSSNSVCTSCNSGFYVSSGSCATCPPKDNCASVTCTSGVSSTCTVCNSGYYLSGGSCAACNLKLNCASVTCSTASNSVCTACNDGFYINGGSCSTCGTKSNCNSVTCSSSSNSVCTSCQVGYYINGAGSCAACTPVDHCTNTVCTTASNSVCTTCNSGYYLSSGACSACTPVTNCTSSITCSTSSNSVCTTCAGGSYVNSGFCSVCIQKVNCTSVTCSSGASSTCTACSTGSYLNSGSCLSCSAKSNCNSVSCTTSANSVCLSCNSGYYLSGGSCIACTSVDHCISPLTCTTASNSVCTSCDGGYLVSGGSCTLSCPSGTYLSGDGSVCIDCTPVANCTSALTCTTSSNSVCTSCSPGTYLSSGTCPTCTSKTNCTSVTCSNVGNSVCTACKSGSYLNSGSCSTCSSLASCNTVTCSDGASSTCTNCNSGYYLNSGSCTACTAVPHCNSALTCTTSSNSVCTSCVSGHFVDSGLCTECSPVDNCSNTPTCSNPSNSVCTSCNSSYYVNSGVCAACTAILNCNSTITCSTSSNSVCTSCNSGYYLNNGACTTCTPIPNCNSDLTCSTSSDSVCTSCVEETYLSNGICLDCLAITNCTSVSCSNGTVSICNSCDEGLVLKNGNCTIPINNNGGSNSEGASSSMIPVIAGAVGGVLFLLLLILFVILVRRRKKNEKSKLKGTSPYDSSHLKKNSSFETASIPMQSVSIQSFSHSFSTSQVLDRSNKPKTGTLQQQQREKQNSNHFNVAPSGTTYNSIVGNLAYDSNRIPSVYTIEGITYSSPVFTNPPPVVRQTKPLSVNFIYESSIVLNSTVYPSNVNRDELYFIREIGSGEFASVHSGKMPKYWMNSQKSSNNSSSGNNISEKPPAIPPKPGTLMKNPTKPSLNLVPCAIKCLKGNSDPKTKRDFIEEGKLMLEMDHPGIVKAFAIFMNTPPYIAVLELLEYGDLLNLLHGCKTKNVFVFPHEFLYIISQISSAMEYLSIKPIIHRDLAARNVLVGSNLLVKISDFGLSRQTYNEKNYYKMNTDTRMPTRWMAPESLNLRKFSTASDVWSFGITCWEIYNYGEYPYKTIPNMEIPNYLESNQRLPYPVDCPLPIYELLLQCWRWDEYERPTFKDITNYLKTQQCTTNAPVRNIGAMVYTSSKC